MLGFSPFFQVPMAVSSGGSAEPTTAHIVMRQSDAVIDDVDLVSFGDIPVADLVTVELVHDGWPDAAQFGHFGLRLPASAQPGQRIAIRLDTQAQYDDTYVSIRSALVNLYNLETFVQLGNLGDVVLLQWSGSSWCHVGGNTSPAMPHYTYGDVNLDSANTSYSYYDTDPDTLYINIAEPGVYTIDMSILQEGRIATLKTYVPAGSSLTIDSWMNILAPDGANLGSSVSMPVDRAIVLIVMGGVSADDNLALRLMPGSTYPLT